MGAVLGVLQRDQNSSLRVELLLKDAGKNYTRRRQKRNGYIHYFSINTIISDIVSYSLTPTLRKYYNMLMFLKPYMVYGNFMEMEDIREYMWFGCTYTTVVYLHRHFAFRPSTGVTEDKMQPFLYL